MLNHKQQTEYPLLCLSIFLAMLICLLPISAYGYENESPSTDNPQQVKFKVNTDDDFSLTGDYYAGDKSSGGVIVLHDCKSNRRRYGAMAKGFSQQGLHTLTLDLRGYGDSVSSEFSRDKIKQEAIDIIAYQSEMALLTTYWQEDLIAAYHFLRSKISAKQDIAIVTSGCSAIYGIALAEKILLNSIVMITPQMTFADKERYKNLIDIPSYFVASSHHTDSYQTTQELFIWNGSKKSKMQIFKGGRYNYQLIGREKPLINDIGRWLALNLNK